MAHELISFNTGKALAADVAGRWLDLIARATQARTPHRVALAGGRITQLFLKSSADEVVRRGISLDRVEFFWGDERCVPPDHVDSNFRLARASLFEAARVSAVRLHRIRGEIEPVMAARQAEAELRATAPIGATGQPVLDLVFLGMGEDGHVASLFPGADPEVTESTATYVTVIGPKPPPRRISLTFSAIQAAREVWVLASGVGKELALKESLSGNSTPMGRVLTDRAHTVVFTDMRLP